MAAHILYSATICNYVILLKYQEWEETSKNDIQIYQITETASLRTEIA